MKTLFDINLSKNTMALFVRNILSDSLRNAIVSTYTEIKNEIAQGLKGVGGIDAYNEAIGASGVEDESDVVRQEQGHEHVVTPAEYCALAAAACDELEGLVEAMLLEAQMKSTNPDGNISVKTLESIFAFRKDLKHEIKVVFDENWGNPDPKFAVQSSAILRLMKEKEDAYGFPGTVAEAADELLANVKKIGEIYAAHLDEITARILQRATMSRRVDARSVEALYLKLANREQVARDAKRILAMLQGSKRGFQDKGKELGWNRQWMIETMAEKNREIELVQALLTHYADTAATAAEGGLSKESTRSVAEAMRVLKAPLVEDGPAPATPTVEEVAKYKANFDALLKRYTDGEGVPVAMLDNAKDAWRKAVALRTAAATTDKEAKKADDAHEKAITDASANTLADEVRDLMGSVAPADDTALADLALEQKVITQEERDAIVAAATEAKAA